MNLSSPLLTLFVAGGSRVRSDSVPTPQPFCGAPVGLISPTLTFFVAGGSYAPSDSVPSTPSGGAAVVHTFSPGRSASTVITKHTPSSVSCLLSEVALLAPVMVDYSKESSVV